MADSDEAGLDRTCAEVGKLSGLLKDGDNVVVVPPRVGMLRTGIMQLEDLLAWQTPRQDPRCEERVSTK